MKKNQKKWTAQKITAILFVIFLLTPEMSYAGRIIKIAVNLSFNRYGDVSWSSLVSPLVRKDFAGLKRRIKASRPLVVDLQTVTEGIGGWKYAMIDFNGFVQRLQGKNCVPGVDRGDDIYRLDNGYITTIVKNNNVHEIADSVIKLNTFLRENKIEFLYVQAPHKICQYDPKLPKGGAKDYSNINADLFLEMIRQEGIDTLDLREEWHRSGKDHYSLFFRTDHHWTPEAGFLAFQIITDHLRNDYGFQIDPYFTDFSHYDKKVLPRWFLGSWGKRVGSLYAVPDDFTIIKPLFETEFVSQVTDEEKHNGKFEDVLLHKKRIEVKSFHVEEVYSCYFGAGKQLQRIVNMKSMEESKIMLIRDSFSLVVSPFLALCCKELLTVDVRKADSDFSLTKLVKQERPDIVIILYHPGVLFDKPYDSFKNSPFNFGL